MKKFFALFIVVAMLSVAGTAMATSITANPSDVTAQRGSTVTVTLTGTASHTGTLSYTKVSGASWLSVNGTTLSGTVPSDALAGDYEVIARVVETYIETDSSGHIAEKTETSDVQVTVHVVVPVTPKTEGGSQSASSQTVVLIVETVKTVVVKVPAVEKVNQVTVAQARTESTRKQTVTSTKSTLATKIRNAVASAPVLNNASLLIAAVTETKTQLVEKFAAVIQDKLSKITTPVLGAPVKKLAQVIPPMSTTESGFVAQDMTFGTEYYGKKIGYDLNPKGLVGGAFFAADAEGNNDAAFLDSTGAETEIIPDGTGSADAGVVTAVVYLQAGEEYEPYVFVEVPQAEEASFDAATGAEEKSVELTTTEAISVSVNTTDTFNPIVTASALAAISNDYGKPVKELPYDAASTTVTWAATADEKAYMTAQSMDFVCSLPVLNVVSDGVYVANIKFDNTPSASTFTAPMFYPNGVNASGLAKSTLYTISDGSATKVTDANAKDIVVNGRSVYLVFEVVNNVVAADFEAAAVTLSKPALVVKETSTTPTPTPTPSGDIYGVGSSSGGCSAGSAVLALALLGTFIAARKK